MVSTHATWQERTTVTDLSPEQSRALEVAHRLVDLGAPIFCAQKNHGPGAEFILPSAWPEYRPNHRQVEMWRPGAALAMVTGVVFDVIDIDPRNGGQTGYALMREALGYELPIVYGSAATPSGGGHHLIGCTGLHKGKPAEGVDLQAGAKDGQGRGFVYIAPTVRVSKWGQSKGQEVAYRWTMEPTGNPKGVDDPGLNRFRAYVVDLKPARVAPRLPVTTVASGAAGDWYDSEIPDWTAMEADRLISRQLDAVRHAGAGTINDTLGGAARVLGRFVAGGYTDEETATRMLMQALTEGGVHSDTWNVANGKGWTAATVIAAGLANGAQEPWTVAEPPEVPPDAPEPAAAPTAGAGAGTAGPEAAGGVLSNPADPMAVARELHARMAKPRVWWRGDFYEHVGTRYAVLDEAVMTRWLYRMTEKATYVVKDAKGEDEAKRWAPTKKKIADLSHALGMGVLQRIGEAEQCIAITNGVLNIHGRTLLPHDPKRFNLTSLPFAYDPAATCPAWLGFLDQVLPGDEQAQDFLAEWFGYVLSGRTNQQKMAALIGKRRSGKGTVARVLGAMAGQEATAGLDLNLAAGTFGIENLIGRSLAISGDVRWQSKNIGDAVPILLGVIGEDVITVHRKNKVSWTGKLGVRFMLMSNETPTFSDRSGALGGRMVYVKFDQSFYGREDIGLTEKLLKELPGILNWALDGLDRLDRRGRFTEPASGQAEADSVRRLSDPIGAFIEDWCEVGPDESISLDHLYLKYRNWCESEGRTKDSTTKEIFSRDLRGKVEGLIVKRTREAGHQVRMLYGISCAEM